MDKSTIMTGKIKSNERNYSPIPHGIIDQVRASGLWICSVYDYVTSAGHSPTYSRNFNFYVIVHLLEGTGFYWNTKMEKEKTIYPGTGLIVVPDELIDYGGYNDVFIEDSIAFTGPVADSLFQANVLTSGLIHFGKARRLLPIIEKQRQATLTAHLEANIMLQSLIFDLYNESRYKTQQHEKYPQLHKLYRELSRDTTRWWTVKKMAEFCNISENHFRRIFKADSGMSPKAYIENMKMQQAVELLCNSQDKISEIALQLGYVDPYHFIRRFKHLMGIPPARYRKQFGRQQ